MELHDIKKTAAEYALKFIADENMQFDYLGDCTADEYFLIQQLAQIYCNLKQGVIDEQEAQRQQVERIIFVTDNADLFAYDD